MPSTTTTRKKRQRRKISPFRQLLWCVLGIVLSFVIDDSSVSARSSNSNSINSPPPQQPRSSSWGRSNKGKRLSSSIESSESSSSSDSDFVDLDAEKQLLEDFFQKKIFDSSSSEDEIGEDDTDTDESLMRNVFRQVDEHEGESLEVVEEEEGEYSAESEKEALYDAYNLLHTLAQDFQKPFDAPAVLVVGHQSSGKSALIEALMGFQFNSVGGGTKTRRPISLRMQYNPKCHSPKCFLLEEDGIERPKSLSEIQAYIDRENLRLQRDPVRNFDPREIQIRMEYKYCPNMILIDTPGLIQSNRPGRSSTKNTAAASSSAHNNLQQKMLYQSAREVERLVINKMKTQEYIILCVEDTNDWKADCRTREIVQKVDPDLSRTVIVNTKLDTKVPQFGSPKDLSDFIKADIVDGISPQKLGGPFFTSVPSGRVYREGQNQFSSSRSSSSSSSLLYGVDDTYDSGSSSVPTDVPGTAHEDDSSLESSEFLNDDDFVQACAENEEHDRTLVRKKLKKIPGNRMAHKELMPRVGLSRLRQFLETKVDECYRRNVCKIVPLLENEYITASKRLEQLEQDLEALSVEKLKHSADIFCDEFCQAVKEAIQGSIAAPASLFGENLEQENLATGSFYDIPGSPMALSYRAWDNLVNTQVGNREHKLYGGSQYHRVLREFNLAARCLRLPVITEDEIANAAGVGDRHDGVNFLRASCVIAIEKARISFDPLLDALKIRMCHVMSKLCPISEFMLRQKRERSTGTLIDAYSYSSSTGIGASGATSSLEQNPMTDITQNPQFKQLVRSIFDKFVDQCSDSAMLRCRDDLMSLTKFVTWDLHQTGSRGSLRRALPGQTDMVSVYKVAIEAAQREDKQPPLSSSSSSSKGNRKGGKNNNNNNQDLNMEHHGDHEIHHHPQHHHDHHSYHQYPHHQQELVVRNQGGADDRDYYNLLQLMEETVLHRDANRTTILVSGLVQHIVGQWRETFGNSVTTKFNCFFLMPFVDDFHRFLRTELQHVYDSTSGAAASSSGAAAAEMSEVFDLSAARKALGQRVEDLREECEANRMLRHKFDQVYKMMQSSQLLLEEENKQQMRNQQENNGVVESALLTRKQTSSARGESSSHSKNNG